MAKTQEQAAEDIRRQLADSKREIHRHRNFLQSVLDGIQDFINIVDSDYTVLYANHMVEQLTGKKREDLIGQKCYRQYWGGTAPCRHCLTVRTFETRQAQRNVSEETLRDGRRVWLERSTFPISADDGRVAYVIEFARDVTVRQQLEREQREQRMELGRRLRELRHAYQEMESLSQQLLQAEKLASVGLMASSLAHELDTPLSTISGYGELLAEELKDVKAQARLKIIGEQAVRCQKTIRAMLDFARKPERMAKPLDVNEVIARVLSLVEHILKVRRTEVALSLAERLPPVLGNDGELQQVVLNLLKNAMDAMPKGGKIRIRTSLDAAAKQVEVVVHDSGAGIPPEHLSRIFQPFFTTKEPGKGTGLGLAICQTIVKDHDGTLTAENAPEGGARLRIRLPAASERMRDER
ncbi:MAG: PAS domain S-box protein [Planctomycetes bacterium]|nr:PAS domain S-box protein [Planctomycetota bacterium]